MNVRFELHRVPYGLNVRAYHNTNGAIVSIEEALASGQTRDTMLRIMSLMEKALEDEAHVEAEALSGL